MRVRRGYASAHNLRPKSAVGAAPEVVCATGPFPDRAPKNPVSGTRAPAPAGPRKLPRSMPEAPLHVRRGHAAVHVYTGPTSVCTASDAEPPPRHADVDGPRKQVTSLPEEPISVRAEVAAARRPQSTPVRTTATTIYATPRAKLLVDPTAGGASRSRSQSTPLNTVSEAGQDGYEVVKARLLPQRRQTTGAADVPGTRVVRTGASVPHTTAQHRSTPTSMTKEYGVEIVSARTFRPSLWGGSSPSSAAADDATHSFRRATVGAGAAPPPRFSVVDSASRRATVGGTPRSRRLLSSVPARSNPTSPADASPGPSPRARGRYCGVDLTVFAVYYDHLLQGECFGPLTPCGPFVFRCGSVLWGLVLGTPRGANITSL